MTEETLRNIFTYHAPNDTDIKHMQELREKAFDLCAYMLQVVPDSADRTAAIRKIREAIMTANAAIVLAPMVPHTQQSVVQQRLTSLSPYDALRHRVTQAPQD